MRAFKKIQYYLETVEKLIINFQQSLSLIYNNWGSYW